jgi:hypothetical protein
MFNLLAWSEQIDVERKVQLAKKQQRLVVSKAADAAFLELQTKQVKVN